MLKRIRSDIIGSGFRVSRRSVFRNVSAGVLGCGLADLLALEAQGRPSRTAKARNVLVIYEEGGISQMDSWDPKPMAPVDHRSPFAPILTSVPGIHFSSLMPKIAGHADKSNSERYGLPHPVMMPSLDRSFSALLEDMHDRGLLDETLVCFITEMGRTPRINKWQGRDHWARAMSIAFAGAGIEGGQVIGQTDREGGDVVTMPYTPYDYAETVYRKLGILTEQRLRMADGRQVEFSEGGRPIAELF